MKWKLIKADGVEPLARHGHRSIAIEDEIITYGGGNRCIYNQLHIYNIRLNKNILPLLTGKPCPGLASYGIVKRDDKLIIFGGMLEYKELNNKIYLLDLKNYHWSTILKVMGTAPEPRFGHSFTLVDENRIFLFGGIINIGDTNNFCPRYQDDLYILHTHGKNKFAWEKIVSVTKPSPRESHSAVLYHNKAKDQKFLVIYGGMHKERLGDVWLLEADQLVWTCLETQGIPPAPRSLHTANIIDSRMFVFGGWIKDPNSSLDDPLCYIPSNTLSCLDLDKNEWSTIELKNSPQARAAHSAVATNDRLYIFSGRSQYSLITDPVPVCINDLWYLELKLPKKVAKIENVCSTSSSLDIKWDHLPNANCYLIEVRRVLTCVTSIQMITKNLAASNINSNSNQKTSLTLEKRKSDTQIAPAPPSKKIILIKSPKIEQMDGCDDDEIKTSEPMKVTKIKPVAVANLSKSENGWCTVGVYKNNFTTVDGYFSFTFTKEGLNDEICPQNIKLAKTQLKSDSMYAFRVFGMNACGVGEASNIFAFRTFAEGFPSTPKNCKFIATPSGLRLAWNPLPLDENIREYFVLMGEKSENSEQMNFVKVYEGKQPTCELRRDCLNDPSRQFTHMSGGGDDDKKCLVFRIAATNHKGVGPFLNVTYDF